MLARQRRAHLARTASDLQIPLQALEAFGHGADNLTVAQKELLTKEFFMPARYDATSDRPIDLNTPTTWKAQIPPPYDPKSDPNFTPHDPNKHHGGYSVSNNSDPNAGKRPGRPGFAN